MTAFQWLVKDSPIESPWLRGTKTFGIDMPVMLSDKFGGKQLYAQGDDGPVVRHTARSVLDDELVMTQSLSGSPRSRRPHSLYCYSKLVMVHP